MSLSQMAWGGEATSLANRALSSEFLCLQGRVTTLISPHAERNNSPGVAPAEVASRGTEAPAQGMPTAGRGQGLA